MLLKRCLDTSTQPLECLVGCVLMGRLMTAVKCCLRKPDDDCRTPSYVQVLLQRGTRTLIPFYVCGDNEASELEDEAYCRSQSGVVRPSAILATCDCAVSCGIVRCKREEHRFCHDHNMFATFRAMCFQMSLKTVPPRITPDTSLPFIHPPCDNATLNM